MSKYETFHCKDLTLLLVFFFQYAKYSLQFARSELKFHLDTIKVTTKPGIHRLLFIREIFHGIVSA